MTDEQILELWAGNDPVRDDILCFARAILAESADAEPIYQLKIDGAWYDCTQEDFDDAIDAEQKRIVTFAARALLAASAPNPSYTDFETWLKGPHARVQTMLDAFDAGKRLANPSDKQEAVGYLSTEPRKWDQCRIKPQGSFTIPVFMHAERNEPLTDEEIEEISHQRETWSVIEFARAILAAAPIAQSAEQDRIDAEYREVGVWEPDGSKFKTYRNENLNGVAMYVREAKGASK